MYVSMYVTALITSIPVLCITQLDTSGVHNGYIATAMCDLCNKDNDKLG